MTAPDSRAVTPAGRWLILTASMGSGHDQVAAQLARGIRTRGGQAQCVDVLDLLPAGIGGAVRAGYAGMLRRVQWLYERIFNSFFLDERRWAPGVYPLDVFAGRRLRPLLADIDGGVVSTFHLAGQVAGRLRRRGELEVPSVVAITEPALHRQWLHPGTDLYLCPFPWLAEQIRERTDAEAIAPGPVVDPRFHAVRGPAAGRAALGLRREERAVLVSAGGWGIGAAADTAARLSNLTDVRPVVLCGHNERLLHQVGQLPGCLGLGWRDDLPELFAAASLLVDQSGGSACAEALACGLPVILHRPLPGHGRLGAATLAEHGLVTFAQTPRQLLTQARRIIAEGPTAAPPPAAVFTADPVRTLLDRTPRSAANAPATPSRGKR